MSTGFRKRRRGILAVTTTLATAAGIAVASVAGAAEDTTVYLFEDGPTTCFTKVQNATDLGAAGSVDFTIQTGRTVSRTCAETKSLLNSAAAAKNESSPVDADWDAHVKTPNVTGGTQA